MKSTKPKAPVMIPIENLVPFDGHPYKVLDDDSMNDLVMSIQESGILEPLTVRPLENTDNYEIISGHRRYHAAKKAGLRDVPAFIRAVSRDEAAIMLVDSNLHRERILPSEKAFAYKMKMDAMRRQGQRTDLKPAEATLSPVETKLRTSEIIAKEAGESRAQIDRYIRLTYLVPELLQFVDEGKIGMRPAVEMSYLDEEVQRDIVDRIDESGGEVFPSHAQTRRIREIAAAGEISFEDIEAIMDEKKPNQASKFKVSEEMIFRLTRRRFTPQEFDEYLKKALECYTRELRRQRDRDAR